MLNTFITLLGTAMIGGFAWIFQLGNRVTAMEIKQEDLPTLINMRFEEVARRLDRIERAMNGSLNGH